MAITTGIEDACDLAVDKTKGLTSGVTEIEAGWNHTCAVVNGGVQCWGCHVAGERGNNSTTDSAVPVQVQFPEL